MELIDEKILVAEIERRKMESNIEGERLRYRNSQASQYHFGKRDALKELLSFIESRQQPSEDLEQEFERFLDDAEGVPRMYHSDEQIEWGKDIARHFAEWQKGQMMEGAVEGKVVIGYSAYVKETNNDALKQYIIDNFNDGDKVKIIIIKEDAK